MMDDQQGEALTQEVIDEAVDFRLALAKVHAAFAAKGEWFFSPWNAPDVIDAETGKKVPFMSASKEQLTTDPECWVLVRAKTGMVLNSWKTIGACSTQSKPAF